MHRIKQPNQEKEKRCWVRDICSNWECQGAFETLFREMHNDREFSLEFFRYFCMSPERFEHLLTSKGADRKKRYSFPKIFPGSSSASNNFMLSGIWWNAAFPFIQLLYREKHCINRHRRNIKAIKDRYLKSPSTEDDWKAIAARFEEVWNFNLFKEW